ncbi:Poly(A) RNA polymerase cid14 [Quillaja saponaria]|uniref:Poly(A) RNA polymerase cid14 n=1 Tax=Quillaja saponaria TaxID=32244 RepID=A0AAD7LJG7_QUISA|nr:Poly(A) RNA polymerase cid14 [Quillaja saponaria]KAJ7959299.1 Poly(A) RNA polymerase cid14 [Quillaja saponaria]KAJ7959300.1 Poly(A) RNA polymerase cid14 [Quillaja saponaria]
MGGHEGWALSNGFIPTGLLPNEEASLNQLLDQDRWLQAEERTAELIACIQPNQPSEDRRTSVACYVERLITMCFPCQVFAFGSVPLKTYLPDGDIDLTVFSDNQNLKDTWANEVRDILEREEKSENAEFRVKEVQYIQAEVKIIKCLVENIVVDISFNQLGGLCTLCFLEEVDHLISQNHIFKRSIILIKAWCYYESRILGAHHGLISTYALETLVLYIFHVFNNTFSGPLEVLYRFLEFFSKFDWDNYCLSLWGPVAIGSLPHMRAEPPRKDCEELLLSKLFLDACSTVYAVMPRGLENQEQHFVSKHFNIVDPLRSNNNLGRSVSKGNFFRIKSAFAFGAQQLARLLDCPEENLIAEVNSFFMNTWDRHGKGHRPDAPSHDFYSCLTVNLNLDEGFNSLKNSPSRNKETENTSSHESEASHGVYSKQGSHSLKPMFRTSNASVVSHAQSKTTNSKFTSILISDSKSISSIENTHSDKGRSSKYLGNEVNGHVDRPYSSPELTGTSSEVTSQVMHNGVAEVVPTALMTDNSKRQGSRSEVLENHIASVSSTKQQSSWKSSSNWRKGAAVDIKNPSSSNLGGFGLGVIKEDGHSSEKTTQMHHEEQDFINTMTSSRNLSLNGYLQAPVNINSAHLPFPVHPSLGYGNVNSFGTTQTNIPSFECLWGSNMHYSQGFVSLPVSEGMALNQEEVSAPINNNLVRAELNQEDCDHGFWPEHDASALRGYDYDNRNIQAQQEVFTPVGSNSGHPSWLSSSGNPSSRDIVPTQDNRWLARKNYGDNPPNQAIVESDGNSAVSSRIMHASHPTSKTKLSSDYVSNGSPLKASNSTRERTTRTCPTGPADHVSSLPHDNTEVVESKISDSGTSLHLQNHQSSSYRQGPMNQSNAMLPVAPKLVGSGPRQRASDNQGQLPFAFYPTGPPVPFLTMLPMYNVPAEAETSNKSINRMDKDVKLDDCHVHPSNVSLCSTESLNQSNTFNFSNVMMHGATSESSEKHRSDILNGDFASYWKNLQYGRFCQNVQLRGPLLHRPSVSVPPMYLQGQYPQDGPGRPPANINPMAHSPPATPFIPIHSGADRHVSVSQHADETPRFRGGTGTYLPNPSLLRDRQPLSTRNHRGGYNYDRKNDHGEREGKWNLNSKPRFSGRGQGHYQVEKPSTRTDRFNLSNRRPDRSWNSSKNDVFPAYNYHNGSYNSPIPWNHGSSDVAYGMYPPPAVNSSGIPLAGSGVPSVMWYPYNQNVSSDSTECLEFESLGPVHSSGINMASHQGESSYRALSELSNFPGDFTDSSSDETFSPKFQRGLPQ